MFLLDAIPQNIKDNENPKTGVIVKIILFECRGLIVSFKKSFSASAKGCNNPKYPTLLGPFRTCMYLNIFRSKRVVKATLTNTHNIQPSPEIK